MTEKSSDIAGAIVEHTSLPFVIAVEKGAKYKHTTISADLSDSNSASSALLAPTTSHTNIATGCGLLLPPSNIITPQNLQAASLVRTGASGMCVSLDTGYHHSNTAISAYPPRLASTLASAHLPDSLFLATSDTGNYPHTRTHINDLNNLRLLLGMQDETRLLRDHTQLLTRQVALARSMLQRGALSARPLFALPITEGFQPASATQSSIQRYHDTILGLAPASRSVSSGAMRTSGIGHIADHRSTLLLSINEALQSSDGSVATPATTSHNPLQPQAYQHRKISTATAKQVTTPLAAMRFGPRETFPMILHRALKHQEDSDAGGRVATFMPDGKSFQIKNQFWFEKNILPVYFPKMKGFASFQRQLNLYDFKRIGGIGIDRGGYHHKLFLRDDPLISSQMKRRRLKGAYRRGGSASTTEGES